MTYKVVHGLYLSWKEQDGRLCAVISDGQPQLGHHDVVVLDVEAFAIGEEAKAKEWFARMQIEQPWNERN